jgi:hypothetical protein
MYFRSLILTLGLLVLARPGWAESLPLPMAWDLNVASPADDAAGGGELCRANPYALYGRGCPDQLNPHPERYGEHLNILDQLLVIADHYKDMNLQAKVRSNAQLKFTMGLVNLYEQEAQARLSLRIQF